MKQTYKFTGDDNKPYGEFVVAGSDDKGYLWYTEEEPSIKHGPFKTELAAYNNAQGYT